MIQAIETSYNGYRFRSRLEARWAVFFDAMSEPYAYEIEGIKGEGLHYLPDFWLSRYSSFVEVKGYLDINGGRKFALLVNQTQTTHYIVKDVGDLMYAIGPDGPNAMKWVECPLCHGLAIVKYCDCQGCHEDVFRRLLCAACSTGKHLKVKKSIGDPSVTPKIVNAITIARSARFEHGETPRVLRGRQNARS